MGFDGEGRDAPTEEKPEKLTVDAGGDSANATFTFHEEDHTIGNTLRYILNKNPEVAFVGYSVPHPSEPKMNLRLQTVGPPATTVLHNALGTVYEIGGHVLSTFDKAVAEFKEKELKEKEQQKR
jgi:DNA-directed RNA polymerase I and III subunit RPAC2|tara:strand:+ start:157 stop:528 length:372 start_codon:yes stop_codon:yes gene_type:complete